MAEEKVFETVDEASAVPRNVMVVAVAVWLSAEGEVITGAAGAVVSASAVVGSDAEEDETAAADAAAVFAGPPDPANGTPAEVSDDFFAG